VVLALIITTWSIRTVYDVVLGLSLELWSIRTVYDVVLAFIIRTWSIRTVYDVVSQIFHLEVRVKVHRYRDTFVYHKRT